MDHLKQLVSLFTGHEVGLADLSDIAVVTFVIYTFLVAVKRTRRSGLIFAGILILGVVYLAARKFGLVLTVTLLQGFFAVILLALVVIFQEDLRYFFERVGLWWVERRLPRYKRKTGRMPRREVEILARTLGDLARAKIGALVVVRGKDTIARHLDGGEEVQGLVSEALLKSIFDPHSLGHDGAVIIDGHVIDRLGCHLPLSKDLEKLPHSGTRHAAALGLSERSDALCIVVSEERGTISIARRGNLALVATPADLAAALEHFYDEIAPLQEMQPWQEFFHRNYREKTVAVGLAVALWVVVVYRTHQVQHTFDIPVGYSLLPGNLMVSRTEPDTVKITLAGQRKAFDFVSPEKIKLTLELWDTQKGRHLLPITGSDLAYPNGLELQDIEPRGVVLVIVDRPAGPEDRIPTTNHAVHAHD
jgi:diadenylate cyclase